VNGSANEPRGEGLKPTGRLLQEQAFHDRQAADRFTTFGKQPNALELLDANYLSHAGWIRPAFEQLGDVRGLDVLDHGCGHGIATVEAIALAKTTERVDVAWPKSVVIFDMKASPPDDETLAAHILGPTGNLKAPTLRRGTTLLVGFSEEAYNQVLG
jgi:hypothetical protein